MKKKILYLALICIFVTDIKAQFNSSKYDDYETREFDNKTIHSVKLNNKWGVVDDKGRELIPMDNDKIKEIFKGLKKTEPLIYVTKNKLSGVLNLENKLIVPFSNWSYISESGSLIIAIKNGPIETNGNPYNEAMDTSYVYHKSGLGIAITPYYYKFNSFEIDTCITKNIYIRANKTGDRGYSEAYNTSDFFIIEPNKTPKLLFEYSRVSLVPDKMFYVEKYISGTDSKDRLNQKKAAFYSLTGELYTTKGDYTNICCGITYPRYEATEYGNIDRYYKDGQTFVIDSSGNKLSEGYDHSVILGGAHYEEEGYFYKFYEGRSITPLCPPIKPKEIKPLITKTGQKKPIVKTNPTETIVKINKYEDVLISVEKDFGDKRYEAYIDFNGKRVCGWYFRILNLPGKYYENNLVYNGGNRKIANLNDEGKMIYGIFSLVSKKEILPTKYDDINLFDDGIYRLLLNGKYGLWFQKENKFIDTIYDNLDEYPTRVKMNGVWGKIEKSAFVPF